MQTYDENSTVEAFRPTREQINEFVKSQVLGVISTLDSDGALTRFSDCSTNPWTITEY